MKSLTIAKREILSFFVSPVAYFVLAGFILLGAYFFFNMLAMFNIMFQRQQMMPYQMGDNNMNLNQWVVEGYYHTMIVILVFLIPLLTMRTFAEEKRRGTFELLMTSPLSIFDIVFGKFLGLATIIFVMVLGSVAFPFILINFGNPEVGPIFSGAFAVLLCALSFASIGMAASSFTENQIVAGVTTMVTLLLLYVIHSPAESIGGVAGQVLSYISPVLEAQDFIKGVISTKGLVYFISLIGLGLFVSQRSLEAERWR